MSILERMHQNRLSELRGMNEYYEEKLRTDLEEWEKREYEIVLADNKRNLKDLQSLVQFCKENGYYDTV